MSFNASKAQHIRFGTQPSHFCPAIISCSAVSLPFTDTVVQLGHILSFDNSDTADILFKAHDLVRKANLMILPWLYFTLPDSTLLYDGSTSLYVTLHYYHIRVVYLNE